LPRLMVSASSLRFAPRSLAWSKTTIPLHPRSRRTNCAAACEVDGTETSIGPVKADRTAKVRFSLDSGAPPIAHPRRDNTKNGGGLWPQCGVGAGNAPPEVAFCGMFRGIRPPRAAPAEIAVFSGDSQACIFVSKPLTRSGAEDYIGRLGAPPPARWRVCEPPHCLRGEPSGHDLWPCRMYGFDGSGTCRRRVRKDPGCLKSESEERETWTAESLRAASSNGEGLGLTAWALSARVAAEETSAVLRFKVFYIGRSRKRSDV
jgi:hypothetical protein